MYKDLDVQGPKSLYKDLGQEQTKMKPNQDWKSDLVEVGCSKAGCGFIKPILHQLSLAGLLLSYHLTIDAEILRVLLKPELSFGYKHDRKLTRL